MSILPTLVRGMTLSTKIRSGSCLSHGLTALKTYIPQTSPPDGSAPTETTDSGFWAGLVFPTRPFHLLELYALLPTHAHPVAPSQANPASALDQKTDPPVSIKAIAEIVRALRGYYPEAGLPTFRPHKATRAAELYIPSANISTTRNIAVTMLKTSEDAIKAAALGKPELSLERYLRFARLANEVSQPARKAQYVLLPEISMPTQWFIPFARTFQKRDIILIAGVEFHGSSHLGV